MRIINRKRVSIFICTVFLLSTLLPAAAFAVEGTPSKPAYYSGTLKYTDSNGGNATDLPAGAVIEAYYNNIIVGSLTTTKAGVFGGESSLDIKLLVNESGTQLKGGETVKFFVNGTDTGVTDTYTSLATKTINLTVKDITGPAVSNLSPANGTSVSYGTPSLSATFSDDISGADPSRVTMQLDGAPVSAAVSGNSISYTPVTALTNGQHTFKVKAYDKVGNASAETSSTFTVNIVTDTEGPIITSLTPANGSTVTTTAKPVISALYSDAISGIDLTKVTLSVDNTAVTATAQILAASVTYTPAQALTNGQHSIKVTVYDNSGNRTDANWSFTVNVQTVTPSPTPTTVPGGPTPTQGPAPTTAPPGGGGTIVPADLIPAAAPTYSEQIRKADGTVLFKKDITVSSVEARAALTSDEIKTALNSVQADADGLKTVVIEMPDISTVSSFTQEFPAGALSASANSKFIFKTGISSFELAGNMYLASEVSGAKTVSITSVKSNTKGLDKAAIEDISSRPVVIFSSAIDGKAAAWSGFDAAVRITAKYEPSSIEKNCPENLTVRYIDDKNKAAAVPTAKYSASAGGMEFKTYTTGKFATAFIQKTFKDLAKYVWAQKEINILASRGVISGTAADTYGPGQNITRADFVLLLVRAFGFNAKFDSNYSDTTDKDYFYNALGIAKKLGITGDAGNNAFRPLDRLTREEMMVFTAKALNLVKKLELNGTAADLEPFVDKSGLSEASIPYVASLVKAGLVKGDGKHLNPGSNASRAEMAVIIYKISGR